MKAEYINSQVLPAKAGVRGFLIKQYEDADVKALCSVPGELALVTDAINKYLRQKTALVQSRTDISDKIGALGFPRKVKTVMVDDEPVETPDETEAKYIGRFIAALVAGEFKHKAVKAAAPEQREVEAYAVLQSLADLCGDTDDDGKPKETPPCYVLDIHTPERVSKPKTPTKKAIENATNIINNKSEKKWIERFTKGYNSPTGGPIPPIPFKEFTTVAPKGATAEEVEAVRQQNITHLAWAIMGVEEAARRNQEAEKAKEFV